MIPIVVYVPLVMQNVAKYRACMFVFAVRRILMTLVTTLNLAKRGGITLQIADTTQSTCTSHE